MVDKADAPVIEEHLFADDGRVPNNPRLPLIVYRGALDTALAPPPPARRASPAMAGAGDGVPEFTLTTTITVPRMKSWASSPARLGCGSAVRMAGSSKCMPATSS